MKSRYWVLIGCVLGTLVVSWFLWGEWQARAGLNNRWVGPVVVSAARAVGNPPTGGTQADAPSPSSPVLDTPTEEPNDPDWPNNLKWQSPHTREWHGPKKGLVVYYSPGLFQVVARNRGMPYRTDVDGHVAISDCAQIGNIALVQMQYVAGPNKGQWGPVMRLQILDCSAGVDVQWHLDDERVAEVDYELAVKYGGGSPRNVPGRLIDIKRGE